MCFKAYGHSGKSLNININEKVLTQNIDSVVHRKQQTTFIYEGGGLLIPRASGPCLDKCVVYMFALCGMLCGGWNIRLWLLLTFSIKTQSPFPPPHSSSPCHKDPEFPPRPGCLCLVSE